MKYIRGYLTNAKRCSYGRACPLRRVSPCFGREKRRNASTQRGGYKHAIAAILCVLFTATIQGLCYADVTKLASEDHKILQDSSRFHEVHSIRDLPPAVVALCADDKRKLADPGQNWRRILRRALRARRNRSQLSHFGCQAAQGRRETKSSLARRWTSSQRLRGVC